MKNANGYGTITKLKGKRRRPYWVRSAMKTELIDGSIKYTRDTIGFYATQKEAIKALADYNDNPFVLGVYTFSDLWDKAKRSSNWKEYRIKKLNGTYNIYFSDIKDMNIKEIKTEHLQRILDNCNKSAGVKQDIKVVMNSVFNYALANDYIMKNYSQFAKYQAEPPKKKEIYTTEEIKTLWSHSGAYEYDLMLILLYTGCRISEIIDNTVDNIDIENELIYIKAAKNTQSIRVVPIHKKILPLFKAHIGNIWLFENKGYRITYSNYQGRMLPKINDILGSEHTIHEARHTFTSELKTRGVDLYYINELTGHKHKNVTEDVYTHADIEKLRSEINKINYNL